MPQQNLFPHDLNRAKPIQTAITTSRAGQPPARVIAQTGPNRETGDLRSRSGYVQQTPKNYPQHPNQPASVAPAARSESQENGRVRLFGWIGRYFEVKRTQSGVLRASFSMATPRICKDPSGNSQKTTVWQRIVVWGESAQALGQRLETGARVQVEGKFKTREWTDSENNLHTITELVARNVRFLDMAQNGMVGQA